MLGLLCTLNFAPSFIALYDKEKSRNLWKVVNKNQNKTKEKKKVEKLLKKKKAKKLKFAVNRIKKRMENCAQI